jgi:twitching motility protein PilT
MNSLLGVRMGDALHIALERSASDIHVVPGRSLAIRVNGALQFLPGESLGSAETLAVAREFLSEEALKAVEGGGDHSVTAAHDAQSLLRVHAFKAEGGISLALRLLQVRIPNIESLHLPSSVTSLAERQRGLIIFAGPTGSGKSTSMASILASINERSARRIITLEDPIEYRHRPGKALISQREIGRDVAGFADAVIGSLRCDPDVIMIGEMRERSTMRAAITAAETGHLVLTTLHTGDSVQTVDRILDAFEGSEQAQIRAQLAASLLAIVCQRLVPRVGGIGRRVAAEVLIATDAVRNTIREARTHQLRNLLLTGRQFGMQTLENHLSDLLSERQIDPETAYAACDRHDELRIASAANA